MDISSINKAITGGTTGTTNEALNLAKSALFRKYLNQVNQAITSGDLKGAERTLGAITNAFPEYTKATDNADEDENTLNAKFATLSKALDKGDTKAAQTAWDEISVTLKEKNNLDVKKDNGATTAAKALATSRTATNEVLTNALNNESSTATNTNPITQLIGGATTVNANDMSFDLIVSSWMAGAAAATSLATAVNNWMMYNSAGKITKVESVDGSSTKNKLDAEA